MLKILLKKEMQEFSTSLMRKNTAKGQRKRSPLLIVILLIYIIGAVGFCFFNLSSILCRPLVAAGLAWLYFALLGVMASAFGIIGNVFTVYTSLYKAKDNNFLLSMPVPPRVILFSRMLGTYIITLFFEFLVFAPAIIVYFTVVPLSPLSLILCILSILILPFLAITISCILAWLIALILSRVQTKNESIVKTVLSLAFLAAYFYVYSQANKYLQAILANSDRVGNTMRTVMYPLYRMGLGNSGDIVSFVIFALIILAVFAVVYLILSAGFVSLSTTNRGAVKTQYREKKFISASIPSALLRRELIHFKNSSVYMLNCALGTIILLACAVLLIIKGGYLSAVLSSFGAVVPVPLLFCAAVCMLATMNDITAPSVSLEGKNIWIVQSMPVRAWDVLKSKLKLHLVITLPPVLICSLCTYFVSRSVFYALLTALCSCCFTVFCAVIGLYISLKMPNLNWTSETAAVKQNMGVIVALLLGWAVIIAAAVIYLLIGGSVVPWLYLLLCTVFFAALSCALLYWISKRGCAIFETL